MLSKLCEVRPGQVFVMTGQYHKAVRVYQHILANAPPEQELKAWSNLGAVYLEVGHPGNGALC